MIRKSVKRFSEKIMLYQESRARWRLILIQLVLRLARLLWRLRRATAIESGLFKDQAHQLLQFRQRHQAYREHQKITDSMYRNAVAIEDETTQDQDQPTRSPEIDSPSTAERADRSDDLTRAFARLSNLPTCPSTG
jgi:hypothetical protein